MLYIEKGYWYMANSGMWHLFPRSAVKRRRAINPVNMLLSIEGSPMWQTAITRTFEGLTYVVSLLGVYMFCISFMSCTEGLDWLWGTYGVMCERNMFGPCRCADSQPPTAFNAVIGKMETKFFLMLYKEYFLEVRLYHSVGLRRSPRLWPFSECQMTLSCTHRCRDVDENTICVL